MAEIDKVWGTTEPLVVYSTFEFHRLRIMPNMRCSFHKHNFKHNAFYVLSGVLFVDMTDHDLCFPDNRRDGIDGTKKLYQNQYMTIKPGVHHQFRTGDVPCVALEMYFTEPLSEDIFRLNVGGPV